MEAYEYLRYGLSCLQAVMTAALSAEIVLGHYTRIQGPGFRVQGSGLRCGVCGRQLRVHMQK